MKKQKSISCYINNGGPHGIINVPMGQFVRLRLRSLVSRLLDSKRKFETIIAVAPDEHDEKLLLALRDILSLNLKPTSSRSDARRMLTLHEKNLKRKSPVFSEEEKVNLVQFAISCGLIFILFMLAAHIEWLQA